MLRTSFLTLIVSAIALAGTFTTPTVSANEIRLETDNYIGRGLRQYSTWEEVFPPNLYNIAVYIDYRPEMAELNRTSETSSSWDYGVRALRLEFLDINGDVIQYSFPDMGDSLDGADPSRSSAIRLTDYGNEQIMQFSLDGTRSEEVVQLSYFVEVIGTNIFSINESGKPILNVDTLTEHDNKVKFRTMKRHSWAPSTYYGFSTWGTIIDAAATVIDEDGDGVADEADLCTVSNTDEAVSFGDIVVSVENAFDENGCSIMDHYAACVVPEEEQPVRGIRSTRSGPSSCEKAVAYDLVADGIISYAEARLLRDALYQSHR